MIEGAAQPPTYRTAGNHSAVKPEFFAPTRKSKKAARLTLNFCINGWVIYAFLRGNESATQRNRGSRAVTSAVSVDARPIELAAPVRRDSVPGRVPVSPVAGRFPTVIIVSEPPEEQCLTEYFLSCKTAHHLIQDRESDRSTVSVAATGFGYYAWAVAVEDGLLTKREAVAWMNEAL